MDSPPKVEVELKAPESAGDEPEPVESKDKCVISKLYYYYVFCIYMKDQNHGTFPYF